MELAQLTSPRSSALVGLGAVLLAAAAGCAPTKAEVVGTPPAPPAPVTVQGGGPGKLAVTRIAHASVLLELGDAKILTDPWFTETSQYHHGEPLGLALEQLPKLTAVMVSHGHYDHFDIDAFRAYPDKSVPFVVGPDIAAEVREAGFTDVRPLHPWESTTIGDLVVTAAPAEHGVPEITFVLQAGGNTVYFGGDTRAIPALDELPKRFPSIQLALLPVNGLHAMGSEVVMTDQDAAVLAGKLHAAVAVPIHYRFHGGGFTDTFILSYHGTAEGFAKAAAEKAPQTQVRILAPGERLEIHTAAANPAAAGAAP